MLRDHAPKFARLNRIENSVGDGVPDVNICCNGLECWVEIKIGSVRRNPEQPIFDKKYGVTVEQINWHINQRQAGGASYLLIRIADELYLIAGSEAGVINLWTLSDFRRGSMMWAKVPVGQAFWDAFWAVLGGVPSSGPSP
jgi:hypothetical protein